MLDVLGAISSVIAAKKNLPLIKKHTKFFVVCMDLIIVVAGLLLYVNPFSLLPIAGVLLHTTAFWINDVGIGRYDRLMQYATEKGVVIAYENIRRLDNVAFAMENYPQAGFCWDVGHEACYMNGMEFMPLFGKRLAAIHLHDNTGIYDEDLHRLPYDGVIDMDRAAMHLADSNYGGALMLEVTRSTAGIESLDDFYPKAYAAAKRFAERVEFYRSGKGK